MSWSSTFFKNCPGFFFRGSFLQRCSLLFVDIFSVHHIHQILTVLIFLQRLDVGQKLVFADPAVQVTDLPILQTVMQLQAKDITVPLLTEFFFPNAFFIAISSFT